jgi:hypothetical protein
VTWELDLEDLTINRERYDEITRTYLFPLETQQEALPDRPELRAYMLSADGRAIQADPLRLRTR